MAPPGKRWLPFVPESRDELVATYRVMVTPDGCVFEFEIRRPWYSQSVDELEQSLPGSYRDLLWLVRQTEGVQAGPPISELTLVTTAICGTSIRWEQGPLPAAPQMTFLDDPVVAPTEVPAGGTSSTMPIDELLDVILDDLDRRTLDVA